MTYRFGEYIVFYGNRSCCWLCYKDGRDDAAAQLGSLDLFLLGINGEDQ
jgi:hypothetical protein